MMDEMTNKGNSKLPPGIPTGFRLKAQGLRGTSYPGDVVRRKTQPQRGCGKSHGPKNFDADKQPTPSSEPLSLTHPDRRSIFAQAMTFTPRCSRSIENAKASLVRFNHTHVTSAHLVLGLLELHGGVAVNALRNFGVSLEIVENYLSARRSSPGDALAQDGSPAGKSAQVACQRAEAQAARFGHTYVGTEHLLLAILLENAGEAADLFASLHVDRKAIGFEVFREIAPINISCQNPNT
jgi:hypothetical protein